MNLTLKKLQDCQDAIIRVGNLPIQPDQPAIAYRMSKNVEQLTKGDDLKHYQRERFRLLRAYGTERLNENREPMGIYDFAGENKDKYDAACDKLDAEVTEIRIRTIDFLEYLKAIKPNGQISPADISSLEFIFTFPADFDGDEKPTEKPTEKQSVKEIAAALKKAVPGQDIVGDGVTG
jgi:hypothetical protein